MTWQNFIEELCTREEYNLTSAQREVLKCLPKNKVPTIQELQNIYNKHYFLY